MSAVLRYPTSTDDEREKAVSVASLSIQRGELVVIPTDTVYGIAADAFDSDAVTDLLEAKGRGRTMPPPVLVSSPTTLDALAVRIPAYARALVAEFWPGPLTLVCHQQTSLQWDLGDTRGTVAVRMPDHPIALEILERTGPLAVSSANLTGAPAATDAAQAEEMLGERVAAIVDAGPSTGSQASTIVDATGATPRLLREGVISAAQLDAVLGPLGLAVDGGATAVSLAKDGDATPTVDPHPTPAAETVATAAATTSPAGEKTPGTKKKAGTKKSSGATKAPGAKKVPVTDEAPAAEEAPTLEKAPPTGEAAAATTSAAPTVPATEVSVTTAPTTKAPVKKVRVRKTTVMPSPTDPGSAPADPPAAE